MAELPTPEREAEFEAARPVWEKAKKILAQRPARRHKNSARPEIWQFRSRELEAARLQSQLQKLARELGIES